MQEGFDLGSDRLVESFARHLMVAVDAWQQDGFAEVAKSYLSRLAPEKGVRREIDDNGDLLVRRIGKTAVERRPARAGAGDAVMARSGDREDRGCERAMKDFWLSCGHHLLDRDDSGRLRVTDEFMKVYLARPELAPPPEACAVERTLHAALLSDPWRPVAADEIAAIAEADARENWQLMIAFRDHLASHRTLEAAYLALVRDGARVPPIFLNQLVHLILRNALDGCDDVFMLRAAELFFRPQRLTVHDGSLLAADEEQIDGSARCRFRRSPRCSGCRRDRRSTCSTMTTRRSYWERSDRLRFGARSDGGPPRPRRARHGDRALDQASARHRHRRRAAQRSCAMSRSPGMSASMPTAPGSATRFGTAERSTRRRATASSGCSG